MEEESLHRELLQRMTKVETLLDEGFKGVYLRQDKTNGKVTSAHDKIRKLEDWKLQINTRTSLIAAIISGVISIIVVLINVLL